MRLKYVSELRLPDAAMLRFTYAAALRRGCLAVCWSCIAASGMSLSGLAASTQETQPQETQPQETQPQETQPQETQPQETQPQETMLLPVSVPPEAFFNLLPERDREVGRAFYKKYLDIGGLPVVAADCVADAALERTHEIVSHMLAGRADVLAAMQASGMYLIIIGKDQVYTDMPEYRHHPNPDYQNERVRGTGGKPTSFGEENLLCLALDRYDDESIAVHEFCHTIDGTLRRIDRDWGGRLNAVYQAARAKRLYEQAYAATNAGEYWAEICQAYFDCNRVNNWNHGPIGTREQLMHYDPEGYELVRSTFRLSPTQDWRYTYLVEHPSVQAPPAKFQIDPYYTKFSWAREFTVLGRGASDAALLTANSMIRKLFAYRHDLLKALIAHNLRLVVLGREESLADLPEFQSPAARAATDRLARIAAYHPDTRLLVVGEEFLTAPHPQREYALLRLLADAIYQVPGQREVDPEWENRPRNLWQQYELRVQRLDSRWAEQIQSCHQQALAAGKWLGTSAIHDPAAYWAAGVLAYFDGAGESLLPVDSPVSISSRQRLREYDPELFQAVANTFAYEFRVDWRVDLRGDLRGDLRSDLRGDLRGDRSGGGGASDR
jgi:hypothetical protein